MKIGINYDTGISPGGRISRMVFDRRQVEYDMRAIAGDLRCDAVRISGGNPERLSIASEVAAASGLEVWFSPMPCELGPDEMLAVFDTCASRAEALRRRSGNEVVLVLGCEVSVFGRGFLPGDDAYARLRQLSAPSPELYGQYPAIVARLNQFLGRAAGAARTKFAGRVTYAAGPWEQVDWAAFDMVGADAYRDQGNAPGFDQHIDGLLAHGKPAAVTEFGCCTYRGAAERGASGWAIVKGDGESRQLDGDYVRDEQVQVSYLRESLAVFERHGVESAFWFTFAGWNRPHRPEPRRDLDIASFGVVKVKDEKNTGIPNWSPKAVYGEFAGLARERCSVSPQALPEADR